TKNLPFRFVILLTLQPILPILRTLGQNRAKTVRKLSGPLCSGRFRCYNQNCKSGNRVQAFGRPAANSAEVIVWNFLNVSKRSSRQHPKRSYLPKVPTLVS